MQKITGRWLICLFALWQTPGWAADRAASLELRADGFAVLSAEIAKNLGEEPQTMHIGNLRKNERGTTVDLVGMNATYRVSDVDVTPTDQGLQIQVGIADFYLTIGRIDVHRMFPVSCYGTSIRFGHVRPAPVHLLVDPTLEEQKLVLTLRSASTSFGADYQTYGPGQCRGRLFNRPLIRSIVAGGIAQSRADFERSLIQRLAPEVQQLAEKMNKRIADSMEFNLRRIDVLPDQDIRIRAYPSSLAVDSEAMSMELGIDVTRFTDFKQTPQKNAVGLLGTFGVSADAISEILGVLLADGSKPLHATPERFPQLAEILHVDIWQEIWPDLGRSDLSRQEMYPVVRMTSAPVVSTDDASGTVTTRLDQVELMMRVEKDGEWTDYFRLVADVNVRFQPQIIDGEFRLYAAPGSTLVFVGDWADDGIARDRTARIGELNELMVQILDGLTREPLIARRIPHVPFQGRMLTLGSLTFAQPYLQVDWVEMTTDH